MFINNHSQINFNGGYHFRNMPLEAKSKIPEISNKWKQVFYDFEKEGDVFLVVRDKLDTKVTKFIKENKLNFEYYPEITTKSGLDTEEPDKLSQLLRQYKKKPITTMTQLNKSISNQIKNKLVQKYSPEYSANILDALRIDTKNLKTEIIRGVCVIDNPEFERKIHISKRNINNTHYVLIEPYSQDKPSERYSMDSAGKIIKKFETPDEIKTFYNEFRKTILK
ncbi:MAG: hypothetical protein E7Z92_02755 [Cyanobacteria bacterium SIG31]|nr:hypothetical protein [Cyanobacteria bacterium SIG31]